MPNQTDPVPSAIPHCDQGGRRVYFSAQPLIPVVERLKIVGGKQGTIPALQRLQDMTRQHKHQMARAAIAAKLRSMGMEVEEVGRNRKYDMIVNGRIRVALRVAFPGHYAHAVTVNGRRYEYDYKSWNFNFHRHGRWQTRYCDVFLCVAKDRKFADEIFVIPASAVTGPTFSLHGAGKPYRGRYAVYRNKWSILAHPEQFLHHEEDVAQSAVA